ncbi:MAG: biotin-dependent carboxyltransferase family protein [Oleiphilaceae bacterium]|nr:biotin-dependent carboxyltransferase family protein [Oleiphilaceae bacterium]
MNDSDTGFEVLEPGPLTLVQDLGRFGYQHLGLSPGGAADEHAFLWGNRLLGNHPKCPALEVTLGGLVLRAHKTTQIALTGADLQARLNGEPLSHWHSHRIEAGDRLELGYPASGVRGYLAVMGGFQFPPVLGSVATVMREKMGGPDGQGRPVEAGDCLPCPTPTARQYDRRLMGVLSRFIPDYRQPLTLGLVAGQQHDHFRGRDLARFHNSDYRLSNRSDRMGIRLEGEPLKPEPAGILSEGIPFGAVQVPPDGQPIVLLKDRQTIGGYPKLGTLCPLHAFALSQRQPQSTVRFRPMTLDEAQGRLRRFYRFFGV